MKSKNLNIAMTSVSAIYLILFIIVAILACLNDDGIDFFSTDGLTIIGCIFALLEILISNRNRISKWIYKIVFFNKIVNYQIFVTLSGNITINEIVESLEKYITDYLSIGELKRRPSSSFSSNRWRVSYPDINCEVECFLMDRGNYAQDNLRGVKISGLSKYGKMDTKKRDILYFSSIIMILGNDLLASENIVRSCSVEKVEIIINRIGSQLKFNNIFNEVIGDINNYNFKVTSGLDDNEEVTFSNLGVKWTTLNSRTLIYGFDKLTNILSTVE